MKQILNASYFCGPLKIDNASLVAALRAPGTGHGDVEGRCTIAAPADPGAAITTLTIAGLSTSISSGGWMTNSPVE